MTRVGGAAAAALAPGEVRLPPALRAAVADPVRTGHLQAMLVGLLVACATSGAGTDTGYALCGEPLDLPPLPVDGSAPAPDRVLPGMDRPLAVVPPVGGVTVPPVAVGWNDWGTDLQPGETFLCEPSREGEIPIYSWGHPAWLPDLDGDGYAELGLGAAIDWSVSVSDTVASVAWSVPHLTPAWKASLYDADFSCGEFYDTAQGPLAGVGSLGGEEPLVACVTERFLLEPPGAFADGWARGEEAVTELSEEDYVVLAPLGADFDGDGVAELAVTGDSLSLFSGASVGPGLLSLDDADAALSAEDDRLEVHAAVDVLGTGTPQVLAARGRRCRWELFALDSPTLAFGEPVATFTVKHVGLDCESAASLGDGDGDGRDEVLFSDQSDVWWFTGAEASQPGEHAPTDADAFLSMSYSPEVQVLNLGGGPLPDVVLTLDGYDQPASVFFDVAGR